MDKIIDIMIASLRARRLLAVKYSDNRELEMLNAQTSLLQDVKDQFIHAAAIKAKKQAKKTMKEDSKKSGKD